MSVRRATEVIERLVVASNASATASPVSSSSWYRVARPCVWNARRALPAVSHDRRDELPPVLGTRTRSNRWTVPEPNVAAVHRKANDLRPRRNNDRGFASSSALRVRDGTGDDTSTPAYVVAAGAFDNANYTNDDETDGGFGSPPQTRGRTDPHLDETGKTPRSSFHASMQSAIDQKNHRKALEVFDTLSTLYCDDQGAPAYDMLMHLAAMGGDPDAATDAFEAALSLGYPPSSYQHGQIILACARKGDPARGADWLDMVLEAEGLEWAHSSKSSRKLFEKTLAGAAHAGDSVLFDSQWQKMMEMRVKPGEDSIEAFLLLASKTGTSGDVEEAWVSKQFAHLDKKTRSSKLSLRRVEAHARIATDLIRRRDGNCVGTYSKPSDVQKSTVRPGFDVRHAASVSRRAAAVALDDLFTRNSEATTFKTRVKNPKDVRDAVTALAGAYSVVGDSDAITALMERSSSVGVEPDQHVFNALLRSEAADRELGAEGVGDVGSDEYYDDASEAFDYVNSFVDSSDTETPTETPTTDQRDAAAQHAVIRVETMMRDMIESGVEPDLHSFMALLAAYARAGDVGAAGDALQGMRERNIPLDNVVYNTLLQACATAGDLDAARNVRNQMKHSNVPADAVTFLHLFRACARRSRQVAQVLKDSDDVWDDWDDWLGGGSGSNELGGSGSIPGGSKNGLGSEAARSHARLAGALVDARSSVNKSGVGEAARAAARAAAEGFVSIGDVFKRGVDGLAPGEAAQLLLQRGSPKSPELQRARAALLEFTEDMKNANVNYTKRCATAAMQALGSLREFGAMMRFLRDPPHGVTPDTYMYTQALHLLAQDPFHWRKGGKESGVGGGGDGSTDSTDPTEVSKAESTDQKTFPVSKQQQTGPAAALALADEMQGKGITQTRVTLNCVLLACAQLRDFDQALIRFEKHSQAGGEIGADTFNCLFKAAWSGGVFSTKATEIAQAMEEANVAPNSFTELTLRNALNAESQRNGYVFPNHHIPPP